MDKKCKTCVYGYPHVECVNCGASYRNYQERKPQTNASTILSNVEDVDCLAELIWHDCWSEIFNIPEFNSKPELVDWLRQPKEDA